MNAFTLIQNTTSMVEHMSNEVYHNRSEFSSSQLKDMLRSSAHFYSNNVTKETKKEASPAMNFGTLVHTMFLEPELFDSEFVVAPKFDKRTKSGKEDALAWEAANAGKLPISAEDLDSASRIVANLRTLSIYKDMQSNIGFAEASIFFTDPSYSLALRIRPDWHIAPCAQWPNGLIIDLKTTDDARPPAFSKTCANFCYDLSAAMYRDGFQQFYQTADKPPFIFFVAERNAPFNVKQYQANDTFLAVGDRRYSQAKERLAESLLLDEWAGYSPDLEDIYLPNYLVNKALDF